MNTDKLTQFDDTTGFVKNNLESIYSTRSWEEMDNTREQALTDYMAGVTEQLTPATSQPDLTSITHSSFKGNPYDTQQEVLSQLSLLDENLNPTQSYTDYINAGGTPVPGYESEDATLRFLDRIDQKQQDLNKGLITEDQMLWDLYSTDILETQGYKIRSVGWWQSKFSNNDFTNPLTNHYLQQQVLQTAREYHNSLQAQKYTKQKQAQDSRLSVLLNKGDLDNEDIAQLFPELTKAIKDTQDDTDYMSYITSGRVSAQQRIYQAETGEYYYLHTDGELYRLSNTEQGSKIASYKQDKDGNFIEISLNGDDAIDLLNSFKSGAASIVTGFLKLGGFLWGATIGAIQEGDFVEGISNTLSAMDSFFNDDLAWMTDSRYVDMDGFQVGDWKDWGMFISSTLGAMTAGAITGTWAGKVTSWGNSLSAAGHPVAGRIVSWGASLYQRSTGLYKGAGTGFYNEGVITKHIAASWLPTFNNLKTVGVYMTKDFMNTTSQLYSQRIQMQLADYTQSPESYDPTKYATNNDILVAAGKVTAVNGLISSILAGGMDDNQTQRWATLLGGAGKDISHPEALNKFGQHIMKYSIFYNTTADFLDNFLTNWTTNNTKLNKDGKVETLKDWNILSAEGARTLTQAAIMTLPTLQKQLQRRNVAAEQATAIHKNYLDRLVEEEQKTNDPHQKEVLQTIRLNYLEDMQRGQVDDKGKPVSNQSQADKILYALSKQHEYLTNSQGDSIVTDVLKKTCDPVMIGIYTNMNNLMEESYESYLANVKDLDKNLETKGIRAFLSNLITEHFKKNYTQRAAALQYGQAKALNGAIAPNGRDVIDNFAQRAVDTYLTITDSKESTTLQENLVSKLGLTSEVLEKSKESYLTQRQLKNRNKDINESLLLEAAQKKADQLNNGDTSENALTAKQVLGASKFFRVKNESEDRPTFNAERAALFVASQVLPDNFYKIDDYTYGMLALDNEISKMFTSDMYSKISVGMNALGSSNPKLKEAGIELMLTSMWGDTATKYFRKGKYDKAVAKDNVEMLLNAAIENKVITKRDAAEFLMSLSDSDNATGKELDTLFKSKVSVTNLNKLDNLSDLEKYTLLYGSVIQLSNKDTNRFSGKTIAAEAMMQQGYDQILFEVLNDIGDKLPDYMKQYKLRAEAARKKEFFLLATDSVIRGLTPVIGDDTIKTESDLKKYLHSLAKDATAKEVNAQAKVLFDMLKDLRRYKSIDYKGDTVSIDISEWSNESYRKMLRVINSTSPEYLDPMLERESLPSMTNKEADQVITIKSADKKPLLTISLDDSNMEQITALYEMLKAGNIIPNWTKKPETAEDMKRILANQVEETKFLRYKNSKEYNTGIISDKDAELIRTRLKQYEPKDIIKTATVFDETIDKEVKAMRYDYFTMLGANISISKLSEAANSKAFRIEGSPYFINPVNPSTLEHEKNGAPIFVTHDTSNENKMGRAASTVSSILGLKNISSYDIAEVNKDLALTLMTDRYIDFLIDNRNKLNIMVPAKYANNLHALEIAGTDNSFYDIGTIPIEVEGKNYFSLTLKDNVTKEAIEVYLLSSKTPNLFKILPFVSSDNADFKNTEFLSPEGSKLDFIPDIRVGNLSDPNGLYQMLNIIFDYDQTGKLRQDLLSGMFEQAKNGKFNYNPFSDLKQELDVDKLCKIMNNNDIVEAYTEYRKGNLRKDLNDPFYLLAEEYKKSNNKYVDNDNNDDYKLWLLHGNVLNRMIKAVQDGDTSISIPEIKKLYAESTNFDPEIGYYSIDKIPYKDLSTNSFYNSPINITGDTVMSKHLLDTATGVDYHLIDEHGNYTLPKVLGDDSIINAFNYVKNNINDFDQTQDIILSAWNTNNNKNYRYYEPSDATHLWTILSAAEGSITIEDLDALTRIEADAYNQFFEELGMKHGYGLEVKKKVDTLYDQLSKYFLTPEQQGALINKTLTFKEPRTGSASTSEQYNRIFTNINSKAAKQAFNNRALEYIQSFEDRPQVTPERLVDGLSTAYDDFDASYKNYKRSDLDTYKAKLYNQKGEIVVNDNGDFHGNQFIDDISSEMNIEKLARSAENTHNSIAEKLNINIKNKDIDGNLIDYATTVTERLTGSKFLGEYAKWSFLDTTTGKEYANAVITNNDNMHSNVDLVKTLWDEAKTNSDWIGKAFIDFEKKDTSGEGLSYRYKVLENENDVINLKNDVLLDLIKINEWKLDGDIDTFINKMSTQEGSNFVNKIITNGITNRDKLTLLDNIFKDTNISNTWQYKILAPTYLTDINKNTIRDIEGQLSSALNSTHPMIRRIGNAILFGIDYDGMDNEHKLSADFIKALLSKDNIDYIQKNKTELNDLEYKINSGEQLTDYNLNKYRELYDITEDRKSVTNALYKYIMRNFENPEVLDYFFNSRRTLNERYNSYINGYDDSYKIKDVMGTKSNISIKDIRDFFNEDNVSYDGNFKKIIEFDTEGSNKLKATGQTADSIKDLFQISFITYTRDDNGNLVEKTETYFIDHGGNDPERFSKWVEAQIDDKDAWYKKHKDYQDIVKQYANLKGIEDNIITEEQVADILNGRLTSAPDLLIAYNGDNYEFRVLKDLLNSDIKTLDALEVISKTEGDTTKELSQNATYKRTFGDDYGDERHTADQDVRDMHELLIEYFNADNDLAYDRSLLVRNLLTLIPEDYRDSESIKNILDIVENKLHNGGDLQETFNNVLGTFKQYEPTLDNIKAMQRAYNNLYNEAKGNVFFKIRESLGYNPDNGYDMLVGDYKARNNFKNVLATKMLETNGDPMKAFNSIYYDYMNNSDDADKSLSVFLKKVATLDDETLNKIHVNPELFDNDDVKLNKQELSFFNDGEAGYLKGQVKGVSKEVAKDFNKNRRFLSYVYSAEDTLIKNKDLISEEGFNIFKDWFTNRSISINENYDIKNLPEYINKAVEYKTAGVDSLLAEIKNIISSNRGTGTFHGMYSMMDAVKPGLNESLFEVVNLGTKGEKLVQLDNVEAGDIIVSKRYLEEILNVHNITDLQSDDPNDKNLYLLSVTNPADNMNSILPLRVRVIDGDDLTVRFTPETQAILRNRDFDGDHTITTTLAPGMKPIVKLIHDYMFNTYNVYEEMTQFLKGLDTDNMAADDFSKAHIYKIGSNDKVVKVCKEIDAYLDKIKGIKDISGEKYQKKIADLNNKLLKTIEASDEYNDITASKWLLPEEKKDFATGLLEQLGIKQTFTNTDQVLRYVNNPALFSDADTYTNKSRRAMFSRQTLTGSNILDSKIGWAQKGWASEDVPAKTITNPLLDMYTPGIYLTGGVERMIDNSINTKERFDQYIDTLKSSIAKQVTEDKFDTSKSYLKDINTELDTLKEFTTDNFANKAKQATMQMLWDLDIYTKSDTNVNKQFLTKLDDVAKDDSFKQQLHITKLLDNKLNELSKSGYSLYSNHMKDTPLADMLQQEAVANRLGTSETGQLRLKDSISGKYNLVNIFMTTGLLPSEDSLAYTDSISRSATAIMVLPKEKDLVYDKLPTNTLIEKGTVIGHYKNGTAKKAEFDFYVNPQKKFKNDIIINVPDDIQGKKLSGQGFFKGEAGTKVTLKDDTNNINLVVDVRNATKNANKYSMGFDYKKAWKEAESYTYTINGKEYSGYILKNVPTNIIGDDDLYTQKINPNDPNTVKRFEVMSVPGTTGLLGIGMYGSSGLKYDEEGNLKLDTSDITEALKENRPKHNAVWGDTGTLIMQLRSEMLAKALGEKAFLGLANKYSPDEFTSLDEYLTNLRNSREKINSQAILNEQNAMIRSLGKQRFINLYNKSDLTRYIFGREVQRLISPEEPNTFSEEFYKNPESPSAKNSGKYQLFGKAKVIPGKYETPEGRNIENRGLIQNTLLHLPFDQFYHGVTGKYLNQNEMIQAIIDGRLGYSRFFDNSAMIENDFTPVDTSMGSREYDFMNKNVANAGEKTITEGLADYFRPTDYNYGLFKKGSNSGNVFEGANDPYKPTFNSLVSKAVEEGHILSGYTPWQRVAYYMSIGEDKTKNTLSKIGTIKGYDSVDMHKYTPQFINKKYGDDSTLNFIRVGEDKNVDLNNIQSEVNKYTKGYMLRKDISDNINKPEFTAKDISEFKKSGTYEAYKNMSAEAREARKEKAIAYKNLVAALNSQSSNIVNNNIKFTWDVENSTTPWKDSVWSRSGIKVDDEKKLAVDIGIKNRFAESQYIQEEYLKQLTDLRTLVSKTDSNEFENFAKYKWLEASKQADPEGYETRAKYMGVSDSLSTLEANYKNYITKHPDVVEAYNTYIDNIINLAKQTSELRNEPFDSSYIFFAPYVPSNKETRYNTVISNIRTMMSINKYDPLSKRNAIQQNMMFNFFEGSERIIKDLSEAYAVDNISKALLGEYTGKALIDNKRVINAAFDLIDNSDVFRDLKIYNKFDSDITNEVLNVLSLYTDIDTYNLKKSATNGGELLRHAYNSVNANLDYLKEEFKDLTGLYPSLDQIYKIANSNDYNESTRQIAKQTADYMWSEIIIGQRIIECSPSAQHHFESFISDINQEGYVLVNKYGQKIERNKFLNPTTSTDLAYLKDNIEIAANSKNDSMWTQFLLEKALSGEIYLAKADMIDQLEKTAYTTKIPNRVVSTLKKISSQSAGFQMALPAKMLGRLMRFTGFDYAMGVIGNYNTLPNISRAAKELSAAFQSDGATIKKGTDLYDYLIREGQPSYGKGVNVKDPINFTEDMGKGLLSKITSKLTSPLEFQNHLGRYAIYLTAKESFDNNNPWYGSQYYNHEAIDAIKDNRDKAMYVMDYMLGSPGGFPALSKKTAGYMMYSTFPMNLTRTMGAYGMSVAKLFQEGVTENNVDQWYNTIIMPSLGTIGISMLGNLIISAICDRYGVDEETEKKWKEEGVSLDPLGTLIGGTPSVVYDSMNPIYNLKEMFINPFTNEYNDTLPKKGYGWLKANMLSKLNPALKIPIEIITGKDLYGDNADGYQTADSLFSKTKKNQYTTLENGMKKVLGYFVGSGVANSIVDERKIAAMESGDDTPSLNSYLWKGITKGVNYDLGNQKTWKKNTSNYYAFLTDMKTWRKANAATSQEGTGNATNANGYYYLDIEDMTDAEKLYYNRTYGSMYGTFDDDDYKRVSSTLKKYINEHRDASTIYAYIVKEYNDNKVSEATMRAALNNNSILRKINQLKTGNLYIEYLKSLTAAEKARLQDAIEYEQEYYPILQYLFPDNVSKKKSYLPSYKKDYIGSGSGSSPKSPYTPSNRYYPGRYYPSTYKFNKKTGKYGPNLKRVQVNVSPQMAIWNQDKNLTQYQTGLDKTNDPQWLRSRDYTSRVYNI